MSYYKLERARCILGCIKGMIARQYGARINAYNAGDIHTVSVVNRWHASVTRRSSSLEAKNPDLPREAWDLLHIRANDELVLALRFDQDNAELIRFMPGLGTLVRNLRPV